MPQVIGSMPDKVTVTIANNETDSGVIDCRKQLLVGFYTPASMTGSAWSLKASHDGVNFFDVTDEGDTYSKTLSSSKYHSIKLPLARGFHYAKIVTGTAQSEAKSLTCILCPVS